MTDEERVEKYLETVETTIYDFICSKMERAYHAGLKARRNEQRKVFSKNCVNCNKSKRRTIKELKAQIEKLKSDVVELQSHCIAVDNVNVKMKCCANCKYASSEEEFHYDKCDECDSEYSEWELKEK